MQKTRNVNDVFERIELTPNRIPAAKQIIFDIHELQIKAFFPIINYFRANSKKTQNQGSGSRYESKIFSRPKP